MYSSKIYLGVSNVYSSRFKDCKLKWTSWMRSESSLDSKFRYTNHRRANFTTKCSCLANSFSKCNNTMRSCLSSMSSRSEKPKCSPKLSMIRRGKPSNHKTVKVINSSPSNKWGRRYTTFASSFTSNKSKPRSNCSKSREKLVNWNKISSYSWWKIRTTLAPSRR